MAGHSVCRLLPTLALAVALAACGSLERRTGVTPAAADSGNAAGGASVRASSEAASESAATDASGDYPLGIRPGDPRRRLNLNVFGLSYHPDREGTRDRHLDNEFNPGLGLNYELHDDALAVTSLEAGFLKDSGRNWAKFGGVGYQIKFGDKWRLGADLVAIHSETYNGGRGFVAPIPHLSYDFGSLKLNAIYIPAVREYVQFSAFNFYITIPMGTW